MFKMNSFNMSRNQALEYVVKPGDSLYKIAIDFNTSVDAIINMNQLPSTMIYPNQILMVPISNGSDGYQTTEGETLNNVLSKNNLTLDNFLKYNDILKLKLQGNQNIKTNNMNNTNSNTTVEDVLAKYGLSPMELLKLNENNWLRGNKEIIVK